MRKIRIAIVGVGNCASSLVQGINFYDRSSVNGIGVGLMHRQISSYRPSDIEVVAAFDIDRRKVGLDVSKAIFSPPNCTKVFCEKIKLTGAIVKMGFRRLSAPHARSGSAPHVPAHGKGVHPRTDRR
jgi:myo-inositol-1-phosphate synthase